MINPSTLLPYGVERPRTLKLFLYQKVLAAQMSNAPLTGAENREAVRLGILPEKLPKGFENVYGGKY